MLRDYLFLVAVASFLAAVIAECPNACSSHGKCGAFDMCVCYKNWMGNDCSERICQFGLAHVDSPKGDLDASSGALTGPDTTIIPNSPMYPYGTTEQFPNMVNSDGTVLTNTAHYYMECSNKGICDRAAGTCSCFEGYDGSSCQRSSCPSNSDGVCSGHGTCHSIKELADLDYGNTYLLWDEDITMGCRCDGGYTGSDCSERVCKYGADPLYYQSCYQNIRYANFTYQFYTKTSSSISGNYSILFQDRTGEDWQTEPISILADCDDVTDALEALPNNVIPLNSVRCYQHSNVSTDFNITIFDNVYFIGGANEVVPKFTIAFPQNPGYIKQIGINIYLDGARPTLFSNETTSTLGWHVYANGFTGEDTDLVTDLCSGVLVTLLKSSSTSSFTHSLGDLKTAEVKLLKKCLGDSDGDSSNNVDVYNWDYGEASVGVDYEGDNYPNNYQNPHLIKLIDATQDVAAFTINAGDNIIVADADGDQIDINTIYTEDPSLIPFPKTQLCASTTSNVNGYGLGWCSNIDPPGFYAVLFYDGTTFNIITRAAQDYSSTTQFHIFTTQGYLTRVSPLVSAYSYDSNANISNSVDKIHSNIVHLSSSLTNVSAIDCVTQTVGSNGLVACVNKDDYVMLLNVNISESGYETNPAYPNIYKVKKAYAEENANTRDLEYKLLLDYGLNAPYSSDVPAAIYKFTPPTGFNYVGQCANRGTCNSDSGLCECYPGYTSGNCGVQNALAV